MYRSTDGGLTWDPVGFLGTLLRGSDGFSGWMHAGVSEDGRWLLVGGRSFDESELAPGLSLREGREIVVASLDGMNWYSFGEAVLDPCTGSMYPLVSDGLAVPPGS